MIYPDGTKTGLFYTEALHPFEVLTQAGFEVTSPAKQAPMVLMTLADRPILAGDDKAVYQDARPPVQREADIAAEEGGGSRAGPIRVVLRFRGSRRPLRLSECTWPAGGRRERLAARRNRRSRLPRPGAFARSHRRRDRHIDHRGKTVTGFTVEGEVVLKVDEKLASDGVAFVVDAVTKAGADYSSPMQPFDDYSITGGRLITGANPASARSAAERALKAFDALPTAPSSQ